MSQALLVDLYELTMAASYLAEGVAGGEATFELFIRDLPPVRNYLVVAGLAQVLDYLETLAFTPDDLTYLATLGLFDGAFLDHLERLRFTGDVWAIPEGEVAFPGEPLVQVTGPLIEAQIVETFLLNCVNFQTAIATKAARVATACAGRSFVDFSARRDHGADAARLAARASAIGGAAGTSNLAAAAEFGLAASGTMAHSYVLAFPSEEDAFRAFLRRYRAGATLLIDTYDTLTGASRAAAVATDLAGEGITLGAVRLDSGDLGELAKGVRAILDEASLREVRIFVSGDLDEYRIAALLAAGAPVDGFGVGTQLGTSGDAPTLGGVYKLVADVTGPKAKTSVGKETVGGVKQVYRFAGDGGLAERDLIAPASEPAPTGGRALLEPVMRRGKRLAASPALPEVAARCSSALAGLPPRLLALGPATPYAVEVTAALRVG